MRARWAAAAAAGRAGAAYFVLSVFVSQVGPVLAQTPIPAVTGTDRDVSSGALDGQRLVIAGDFQGVGRPCGSWVSFDLATGAADENGPVVSGELFEAISDGSGGFFLAGRIRGVNGIPRQGLAHIRGDGTLAPWAPAVNDVVVALALRGDTLFVGGWFTQVNGAPRAYLAALDADSGALLPWNVLVDYPVEALDVVNDTLFVGGYFRALAGQPRQGIGAIDVRTATATPWTIPLVGSPFAIPTPIVTQIVHDGRLLYVGGDFNAVDTVETGGFAVVDRASGQLQPSAPLGPGASVARILVHGGRVYVSGDFWASTPLGWVSGLFAISRSTLQTVAWAPVVPRDLYTGAALAATGDRVFVSEGWGSLDNNPEPLNVVDTLSGQAVRFPASIHSNGGSIAFAIAGGRLFAGGPFRLLSSTPRQSVAEIDLRTGGWTARTFDLLPGEVASRVAADAGQVFVYSYGHGLVAFDTAPAPIWRRPFFAVDAMLAAHGHLIVAGHETSGSADAVLDIDPATGVTRPWAPTFVDPTGPAIPFVLAFDDERLYAGGSFQSVNGQPTGGIAAFRWSDLGLEPTSFGSILRVLALAVAPGQVIAVGDVAGRVTPTLAALDPVTGVLSPWAPLQGLRTGVDPSALHGIAVLDGNVYAAYDWSHLLYRASLTAPGWAPYPLGGNGWVTQLTSGNGRLLAIGPFIGFGPVAAAGVGAIASPNLDVPRSVETRGSEIALWPDPARDRVAIRLSRHVAGPARLDLFDVSGRLLRRVVLPPDGLGPFNLDLIQANGRRAEPGVHFAVVTGADGRRSTARFVVLR